MPAMYPRDAIRDIMKAQRVKQIELSRRLGVDKAVVNSMIERGDSNPVGMQVRSLVRCASALGYDVVLRPRRTGRIPDGEYVILGQERRGWKPKTGKSAPKEDPGAAAPEQAGDQT